VYVLVWVQSIHCVLRTCGTLTDLHRLSLIPGDASLSAGWAQNPPLRVPASFVAGLEQGFRVLDPASAIKADLTMSYQPHPQLSSARNEELRTRSVNRVWRREEARRSWWRELLCMGWGRLERRILGPLVGIGSLFRGCDRSRSASHRRTLAGVLLSLCRLPSSRATAPGQGRAGQRTPGRQRWND
jgi:hypothetical protein